MRAGLLYTGRILAAWRSRSRWAIPRRDSSAPAAAGQEAIFIPMVCWTFPFAGQVGPYQQSHSHRGMMDKTIPPQQPLSRGMR